MLYLLTYADMRAVGPGVLTGWQAQILHELYARTLKQLTAPGAGVASRANRTQVSERLYGVVKDEVDAQAVKAHVAMVSDRYLTGTSVQRMAAHLRMLQRIDAAPLATDLFHHPDLGSSDLVVVTRDLPGLFSLIAGTLAAHGINITSAQIHTRADGIAIDTFQVNDPTGEAVTSAAHWRRTMDALAAVIGGTVSVDDLLERRRRAGRARRDVEGPPKITIDNELSDAATVIEVKCPDRVGLLYLITRTISGLGLDIASARIATEIDQAYDTFYVHDHQGQKLEQPDAMDRAREVLEQALVQPL
jgi:[protein-PII] uridylyltransferase